MRQAFRKIREHSGVSKSSKKSSLEDSPTGPGAVLNKVH